MQKHDEPTSVEVVPKAVFTDCYDGFDCADVVVPIDHAARMNGTSTKTLSLRMIRAPALDPASRIGVLVVDPGGPGSPFVARFAERYPGLQLAFPEIARRFDVVAIDWRGVGQSTPIRCTDDAEIQALRAVDLAVLSPAAVSAVDALRVKLVEGCRARADAELLPHMSTVDVAHDVDIVRRALGEERISFFGFSYGGWLGATYATAYGAHLRALAFDSPTYVEEQLETAISFKAGSAFLGLDRFYAACAADPACKLGGAGVTKESIGVRYDALVAKVAAAPIPAGPRKLYPSDLVAAVTDGLRAGDFAKLATDLATAEAGDATALMVRSDAGFGVDPSGHEDGTFFARALIVCLDAPLAAQSMNEFGGFAHALSHEPRSAPIALEAFAMCVQWPWSRATPRLAIDGKTAPPALIVAGANDPIVPYRNAEKLAALLGPKTSIVTYEGEGHSPSLRSACLREAITAYLVDPTAPPKTARCAAK